MNHPEHEYAGFRYVIVHEDGEPVRAEPVEGQHPAAAKDKHRRAALETFVQERT